MQSFPSPEYNPRIKLLKTAPHVPKVKRVSSWGKLSPLSPDPHRQDIYSFPDTDVKGYGTVCETKQGDVQKKQTEEDNFWGMILVASFLSFWTVSAAIISRTQGSTLQWTLSRYIAMSVYCVMHWMIKKPASKQHFYGDNKRDILLIMIHGILENIWVYTYFYALHTVYIGDIEAIFLFVAPTVIALIGRSVFKEEFPKNILIIVIIDIVGVIFVTQPSFIFPNEKALSPEGMILILISTVIYSLDIVLIGQNEQIHWLQMQIGASLQALFIYFPLIFGLNMVFTDDSDTMIGGRFDWSTKMLCLNAAVGVVNLLSQICLIYGYQMGASTKVVWLEYVNLIFAYGIQWLIFREISDLYEIIGAALIASTFFIQFVQQYIAYKKEIKYNSIAKHSLKDAPKEITHLLDPLAGECGSSNV